MHYFVLFKKMIKRIKHLVEESEESDSETYSEQEDEKNNNKHVQYEFDVDDEEDEMQEVIKNVTKIKENKKNIK